MQFSCAFNFVNDTFARSVYCPEGSALPTNVSVGYFSVATSGNTFREASSQVRRYIVTATQKHGLVGVGWDDGFYLYFPFTKK